MMNVKIHGAECVIQDFVELKALDINIDISFYI